MLFGLFGLLLSVGAFAQEAPYIRNFFPDEYGGQNQNWSLAQSPEGWLWAGNNGGLLEFEGATWRGLSLPEKQTVRAVAMGADGTVFCGGFAEFGYWKKGADGQFAYTSLSQQVPTEQLRKEEIWHIVAAQGSVYFQSFSRLYKFDFQKIITISPPASIMFATEVEGQIWVPVIGKGLYQLLPDGRFQFVSNTEVLKDEIVQFVVPNGRGGVWAGTTNHGIFEVQNGHASPWANPLNADFKKHQLNKALRLRNGGFAIGTILGGVYVLDKTGGLRFHLDRANGLQNNTVLALAEDRDGNLWAGLDRGIDFIQLRSPLTFFSDQTGKIGTVYTAAQWQGRLYLGTNQGVFSRPISAPKASVPNVPFQLVEGSQGQVWQLQVFDGQLICGHNGGTFSIQKNIARKISDVTGGWCTVRVPGRPDVLLQSTYTGLVCFKKDKAGAWAFAHRVGGFAEPMRKIVFDSTGNVWGVHPNQGMYLLRLSDDLRQTVSEKAIARADGLPSDFHLDLEVINGEMLVNTEQRPVWPRSVQGEWRFEKKGHYSKHNPHKWLAGIGSDYFWLNSTGGVWLMAGHTSRRLPLRLVPHFERVTLLPDSTYLFCLENGYALLDRRVFPDWNADTLRLSPVVRWIETTDGGSFLPTDNLVFAYAQNSLKFRFALPFFERPPKFSWRLDGFSKAWSEWQPRSEKEFTNLPEGHYTFRVRSDAGGAEAVVSFRIAPPWYRSGGAFVCYVLLFLALLWLLELFNRRRLERQRQRLESEKEREILVLEVENKNRELSNAAFNLIRKNEALQGLKDELLAAPNDARTLQKMARHIDEHLEGDHDWEIFEESFNRVHDDFFKRLMQQFPELTPGDMRLAAYLKMNLSSKEIAPLLNISVRGIENKRYRLRKKLGLPEEANLTEFILRY
ncbi:MAG: two-component regulator propeller domain-containing protein [Saprospiraceae bacterium]